MTDKFEQWFESEFPDADLSQCETLKGYNNLKFGWNAALSSLQGEAVEVKSLIERLHRCCEHAAEYCDTEHYHQSCARVDMAFWQLFPNATQLFTYPPSAAAKITELEAKLAEVEKDAERYRWLRHGDNDDLVIQHGPVATDYHWLPRNERLDDMIDAAIQESKKGGV